MANDFFKRYEVADRGFFGYEFKDLYGQKCTIQESSLATDDAIWLGVTIDFDGKHVEHGRMHLNREMAIKLMAKLAVFIEDGGFHGGIKH